MRAKIQFCTLLLLIFAGAAVWAGAQQDSTRIRELATLAKDLKKSDPKKAITYCEEGIALAQKTGRKFDVAVLKNRLGTIHLQLGNYKNAANQFYSALALFQDLNRPSRVASTLNNLGILYKKQERYDDAMVFFRKSYAHQLAKKNRRKQATALNNIGLIHKNLNALDSAEYYYFKALKINREIGNKAGQGNNYHNLGNSSRLQGYLTKALLYYDSALVLKKELNDLSGKLKVEWNKTIAEFELNQNKLKTEKKLKRIYSESLDHNFLPIAHGVVRDLSEFYAKTNEIDSAYKYLMLANTFKDSLINVNTSTLLDNLSLNLLEKENKDKMAALEERNQAQLTMLDREKYFNRMLLIGIAVLTLLSALVLFLFYVNQKNSKKLYEQNQRIDEANKNLELINADLQEMSREKELIVSMIAHDLKSPIDQIKGLLDILRVELEEKKAINSEQEKYFDATGDSFERVYSLISEIISARKKKEENNREINLHDFVEGISTNFQVLADKKRIEFIYNLTGGCSIRGLNSDKLTRIIENLLSNAIKYSPENSKIEFNCGIKNDKVFLSIKDEGPGISSQQIEQIKSGIGLNKQNSNSGSHGLGLQIVAKFLDEIGARLEIKSSTETGGSTFTIVFP